MQHDLHRKREVFSSLNLTPLSESPRRETCITQSIEDKEPFSRLHLTLLQSLQGEIHAVQSVEDREVFVRLHLILQSLQGEIDAVQPAKDREVFSMLNLTLLFSFEGEIHAVQSTEDSAVFSTGFILLSSKVPRGDSYITVYIGHGGYLHFTLVLSLEGEICAVKFTEYRDVFSILHLSLLQSH